MSQADRRISRIRPQKVPQPSWRARQNLRKRAEAAMAMLIDLLDAIDGDADMEDIDEREDDVAEAGNCTWSEDIDQTKVAAFIG